MNTFSNKCRKARWCTGASTRRLGGDCIAGTHTPPLLVPIVRKEVTNNSVHQPAVKNALKIRPLR